MGFFGFRVLDSCSRSGNCRGAVFQGLGQGANLRGELVTLGASFLVGLVFGGPCRGFDVSTRRGCHDDFHSFSLKSSEGCVFERGGSRQFGGFGGMLGRCIVERCFSSLEGFITTADGGIGLFEGLAVTVEVGIGCHGCQTVVAQGHCHANDDGMVGKIGMRVPHMRIF